MATNRGQLKARLQDEGRWEAFKARREKLKAEGMTPAQANWQAETEFASPRAGCSGVDCVPAAMFRDAPASTLDCAKWVARHLAVSDVKPRDAPTSEAWGLLRWAKGSGQAQPV